MNKKVVVFFTAIVVAFSACLVTNGDNCPDGSSGQLASGPNFIHSPVKGGTTNPKWSEWQAISYSGPDGDFNVVVTSMRARVVIRSYTCTDYLVSYYECSSTSGYYVFDQQSSHSYTLPENESQTQTVSWSPPYTAPDGTTWSVSVTGVNVNFNLVNIDVL